MNESERQDWEQARARGKFWFIVSGIPWRGFKFAAPFTIAFFLIDLLTQRVKSPWSEAGQMAMIYALLTLAVGGGEGAYAWFKQKRDYQGGLNEARLKRPPAGH